MSSTKEVKRMFDLCRQYDVYEPWLKDNGFSLEDLPLVAENETGERVIIEAERDENGNPIWKISTLQEGNKYHNWIRVNYYYEDGTVEELYEH